MNEEFHNSINNYKIELKKWINWKFKIILFLATFLFLFAPAKETSTSANISSGSGYSLCIKYIGWKAID